MWLASIVTSKSAPGSSAVPARPSGRPLRSVCDLTALGERQIIVDCDVLQADGGTRTASITGGYLALHDALSRLVQAGVIGAHPLTEGCAAAPFTAILNGRFKGGWTTRHYGRPAEGLHAIQMEIAQSAYLEAEAEPWIWSAPKAARLRPLLSRILSDLAAWRPA